jgi:hypothetical protein
MKPRDEIVCAGCGRRRAASRTGRPARWCSPACRTHGWRERTRDANHPPDNDKPGFATFAAGRDEML